MLGHIPVGPHVASRFWTSQTVTECVLRPRVDYGTLALLFQDNVGGLEVENPHTKQFQPAAPMVCSSEQSKWLAGLQ